jgi:hypothetical protein
MEKEASNAADALRLVDGVCSQEGKNKKSFFSGKQHHLT